MKSFPQLARKTVEIDTGEERVSVPMIPVGQLDRVFDLANRLEHLDSKEQVDETRRELIEIAKQSLPEKYHANLARLRLVQLIELVSYLAFGEDADGNGGNGGEDADAAKKNAT